MNRTEAQFKFFEKLFFALFAASAAVFGWLIGNYSRAQNDLIVGALVLLGILTLGIVGTMMILKRLLVEFKDE